MCFSECVSVVQQYMTLYVCKKCIKQVQLLADIQSGILVLSSNVPLDTYLSLFTG